MANGSYFRVDMILRWSTNILKIIEREMNQMMNTNQYIALMINSD